jgi:hypothetical protein
MIYLYVKTHIDTGLKYFGKTTKKDPHKYTGSGKYWKRHLKKHGSNYSTEIIATFEDEAACQEFALDFSRKHDIVDSDKWANLQEENGLDGAPTGHKGHKFTKEQLDKISETSKQRWENPEFKKMMIEKQKWSDQRKEQQSLRLTGIKRPEHSQKMKGRTLDPTHPFFNETKSEDHKNAISEALKGKPKSEQHIQNQKESLQNRTPERWRAILETRRKKATPKFEIDGVAYTSLKEASEKLNTTPYKVRKLITRHL